MIRRILALSVLFVVSMTAHAAESWQQIEQPLYRLIFPDAITDEAVRVANKLDLYLQTHLDEMPLDQPLKQVDIILYAQSHVSNGNVGLMPYRSNWYNKPGAFARLEWFDALSVHEGRHIVQFNQVYDNTIGRALSFAFGDLGVGVFAGLFVPGWYLEGDAVVSETTLTQGGRGRVASFNLWMRTDLLNNTPYSYDRAMLGTGFDRVPYLSPYVLGYYLTGHIRQQTDPMVFDRVVDRLGSTQGFNFNGSLKQETGRNLNDWYAHTMDQLKQDWQRQQNTLDITDVNLISTYDGSHWQSLYPIYANDEFTVAVSVDVKRGYSLVEIRDKNLKQLTKLPRDVAAQYFSGTKTKSVSSNGQQHCWVATVPNTFALNKETGDLFCWSKATGLEKLTSGEKFTGIQHTASGFIAHRFSASRKSELVITNERGQQLNAITLPTHSLAHDISNTSSGITFVLSSSDENGLYELNPTTFSIERLVANDDATLRSPLKLKNWLLYTSDGTGIDQPMAMSLTTQQHFQIATRPYGTYFLAATEQEDEIILSDYQPNGQQLVRFSMPLTEAAPSNWLNRTTLTTAPTFVDNLIDPDVVSGLTSAMQTADINNYTLSKYRPLEHLWNPHSWGVMATPNQLYGFINSQDVLDKLAINLQAGVDFSVVETFASINTTYQLDSGLQLSAAAQKNIGDEKLIAQISRPLQWRHGDVTTSVTPRTAVEVSSVFPARAAVELSVTTQKDRGFQQLQTPLGLHQRLYTDIDANTRLRLLSSTSFATLGLSSTHAINADLDMQWLEIGPSLLASDPVLSPIIYAGFSAQASADYRVNLGQAGKSLIPGLYWRNTELSLNGRSQHQASGQESAIGLTLQPSFNLLQNANLIFNPSASFYYLIDSDSVRFTMGASIANF